MLTVPHKQASFYTKSVYTLTDATTARIMTLTRETNCAAPSHAAPMVTVKVALPTAEVTEDPPGVAVRVRV